MLPHCLGHDDGDVYVDDGDDDVVDGDEASMHANAGIDDSDDDACKHHADDVDMMMMTMMTRLMMMMVMMVMVMMIMMMTVVRNSFPRLWQRPLRVSQGVPRFAQTFPVSQIFPSFFQNSQAKQEVLPGFLKFPGFP